MLFLSFGRPLYFHFRYCYRIQVEGRQSLTFTLAPTLYKRSMSNYIINLYDFRFYIVNLVLPILLISNIVIFQHDLLFLVVEAQQKRNNATASDMASMRNTIIPQAREVNESNLELIKICTASPNSDCDNTMIIIHNDCIAYPGYVAIHIPSCNDSRLISYLIARGLLE
jgi:hypothetical protein